MMYNNINIPQNANNIDLQTNQNISSSYPFINQNQNHNHHHPIMIPVPSPLLPFSGVVGAEDDDFPRRDERYPQWNNEETRDLIEVRAQLEWDFSTVKRNKNLWEMVVNRMREKGYRRTIDQCKCKWKNLVNRYKGQQVSDLDNGQQFPFFDELHAIFTARVQRQQQAPPDYEPPSVQGKNKRKVIPEFQSHEDFLLDQDAEEETETNPIPKWNRKPAQSEKRLKQPITNNDSVISLVRDMLSNFIQQQQWIDMQWKETMEKREQEREAFEHEWRRTMEKLERERIAMEQAWREREEQRKLREESRAEKRDALLNALMNKLVRDDDA